MTDNTHQSLDSNETAKLLTAEEIRNLETKQLLKRRRAAFLANDTSRESDAEEASDADLDDEDLNDTVGLAISGGGLRSATFNDGMLTAFSHRGLLRYVDYISAVSGGAYITGNLLCRGKDFEKLNPESTVSFHDASVRLQTDDGDTIVKVRDLGVDPTTGKPERGRLEGVGKYLNDKSSLICSHVLEFICRLLIYVGLIGSCAAVTAIFFRSFDNRAFRHLYFNVLSLGDTNEFGIALLPTIWLTAILLFSTIVYRSIRYFIRGRRAEPGRVGKAISSFSLCVVALFTIASFAIFLGNGYTGFSAANQGWFKLEDWALTLGSIAAIFQILVFFSREKLLKSEQQSASKWQKLARTTILTSSVLAVVFFSVYFVGRENISEFANKRERDLRTEEVKDWHALLAIQEKFGSSSPQAKKLKKLLIEEESQKNKFMLKDSWRHHLMEHHDVLRSNYKPATDIESEGKPKPVRPVSYCWRTSRLLWTLEAWRIGVFCSHNSKAKKLKPEQLGSLYESMERWCILESEKRAFLDNFNSSTLQDPRFHKSMMKELKGKHFLKSDGVWILGGNQTSEKSIKAISLRMPKWSQSDCKVFANNCVRTLQSERLYGSESGKFDASKDAAKKFGRNLIHVLHPSALEMYGLVSTKTVHQEDQLTRFRWLFWFVLTALAGFVVSAFSPCGSLYRFYRNSIADHFFNVDFFPNPIGSNQLVGGSHEVENREIELASTVANRIPRNSPKRYSNCPMSDFDLTGIGFPIPIINCSEVYIDDRSKEVVADAFAFTPHYVGSREHGCIATTQYTPGNHIGNRSKQKNLAISDAICISGAALSTKMSKSFGTRMIMDLFGVNLGRYLVEPNKQIESEQNNTSQFFGCRWNGYLSKFRLNLKQLVGRTDTARYRHIADGGFSDYLGVIELLERKCRLIIVSDAGINTADDELQHLARMLEKAKKEMGIQFYDLDHDAPLNFLRLDRNLIQANDSDDTREDTVAPQQFVCMRVRYPDNPDDDAYLIYAQMVICEDDPLEIKQIRQKFPDFPDEPTTNQFFTQQQVDAYHRLGYYIGSLICSEAEPWSAENIVDSINAECQTKKRWHLRHGNTTNRQIDRYHETRNIIDDRKSQPLFDVMLERLLLGYRMACYREKSHSTDDVFSEAIWQDDQTHFPHFSAGVEEIKTHFHRLKKQRPDLKDGNIDLAFIQKLIDYWMVVWERNADIRNAYRDAVFQDINLLKRSDYSEIAQMQDYLWTALAELDTGDDWDSRQLATTLHLASMAMACQQFHTAWLGKIFQIGGRKKLVALIAHMGEQICKEESPNSTPEEQIDIKLRNLCPGLLEMQTCVFRKGGQNVVVSFAVCLSISLNLVKQPNIQSLRIDWCSLSDFIAQFGKALNSQSRIEMVNGLKLLSKSVRPQFRSTAEFIGADPQPPEDDDPTEIGQLLN